MGFLEAVVQDSISIDFGSEVTYGSDQVYNSYPCRFATVGFSLMPTTLLDMAADRIRKDMGFKPMHPVDEFTDEMCDQEGWYEYGICINDWNDTKCDSCIWFYVENSASDDNGQMYSIDLGREEQEAVYARLDAQCREYLGKSCAKLLQEARRELEAE